MRLRGPCATSPPAQMLGCDVRSVIGIDLDATAAEGELDPSQHAEVGGLADGEDHRVGREHRLGAGDEGRGEAAVVVEDRAHVDRLESGDAPVAPTKRCGPLRYMIVMPSASASAISSGSAGISSGDSSAMTVTSSTPARTAARATSSVVVIPRRASSGVPATAGTSVASGRPAAARSAVRAASKATLPPPTTTTRRRAPPEALVDVEQELDGAQDAVELVAGQVEVAPTTGADGDEERVVPVEELVEGQRRARPGTTARRRCRARGWPRSRGRSARGPGGTRGCRAPSSRRAGRWPRRR